jgi:hypothetical protein
MTMTTHVALDVIWFPVTWARGPSLCAILRLLCARQRCTTPLCGVCHATGVIPGLDLPQPIEPAPTLSTRIIPPLRVYRSPALVRPICASMRV